MESMTISRPKVAAARARVLVVEDEELVRDALGPLLERDGYEVSFAGNGREALQRLYTEAAPDLIVLDLRMPVMDGWEFRVIQKDDPRLDQIPLLAISADNSPAAVAISADAYLHKPVVPNQLLATIERVLVESRRAALVRLEETERLSAVDRLAAGVGHEINNPLAVIVLNVNQSLKEVVPTISALEPPSAAFLTDSAVEQIRNRLLDVADMLEDCKLASESIRATVADLQRLSQSSLIAARRDAGSVDINALLERALSLVMNQISGRAHLIKVFAEIPLIAASGGALVQVFVNLLTNAAQAVAKGEADSSHEIQVTTGVHSGVDGPEVVVEVKDSGEGLSGEALAQVFEPFFITKRAGFRGLGLSVSRQTVLAHGGRITVHSDRTTGTVFRVFLPVVPKFFGKDPPPPASREVVAAPINEPGATKRRPSKGIVAGRKP